MTTSGGWRDSEEVRTLIGALDSNIRDMVMAEECCVRLHRDKVSVPLGLIEQIGDAVWASAVRGSEDPRPHDMAETQDSDVRRLTWLLRDVANRLPHTDVGRERYGELIGWADNIEHGIFGGLSRGAGGEDTAQPPVNLPPIPGDASLTVVLLPEDRAVRDADAAIARIDEGQQWVVDPPELFLHQLRLRCAQDPSLLPKIKVFFLDENREYKVIGLRMEDELRWPVGFLHAAWEIEIKIGEVRDAIRKTAASSPSSPSGGDAPA